MFRYLFIFPIAPSVNVLDLSGEMARLRTTVSELNRMSEALLEAYRTIADNSGSINAGSKGYVVQMEALNRNVSGLATRTSVAALYQRSPLRGLSAATASNRRYTASLRAPTLCRLGRG